MIIIKKCLHPGAWGPQTRSLSIARGPTSVTVKWNWRRKRKTRLVSSLDSVSNPCNTIFKLRKCRFWYFQVDTFKSYPHKWNNSLTNQQKNSETPNNLQCKRKENRRSNGRLTRINFVLLMSNFGSPNLIPNCRQLCTNGIFMEQNLRIALRCLLMSGIFE